jgi:membrane protease YdiL (CAAX protease family)
MTVSNKQQAHVASAEQHQYNLWQILGIWLAGGIPMWLLGWVVYPLLSASLPPMEAGLLRIKLMTIGLVWQFVLSMIILYHEEGNIRLTTIGRRFRLNHPISPKTGETKKALWWWIIPLVILVALIDIALRPVIVRVTGDTLPFLAVPKGYDMSAMFTPELFVQWVGAWGWFVLFFVFSIFNSALGEELLFRGVLLPKMNGVFGKWDWVANGLLFGFYHIHQPWGILSSVLTGWVYAFSAKRFHTTWFSIVLHSGQNIYMLCLIVGLVLGLA